MEILLLLIGLIVGGAAAWFIAKFKFSSGSDTSLLVEQERSKNLVKDLETARHDLNRATTEVLALNNRLSTSDANHKNLQERLTDQKKELESLQEKFSIQFRNLANDIFEEKSKKFTEQNKSNIFDILKPLGEKINEFEKKVEDTNKDGVARNAALREQLENLQKLNIQMTRDAENLTRALKGDSKTQGAWGEFILESILQKSGLEKNREYTIQESFTTEESRLRPDVIVKLPDEKHIIIDSKVSLTAYNNFVNAASDEDRVTALKAHLLSVRQHMKGLSDKKYQTITQQGLDFIIMFIPIEPAYILAIQSETGLYEEALEKRIVFVSPTLLIPSLQLIKNGWKQENQNKNTLEIVRQATALYEKFTGLTNDLIEVGKQMRKSQEAYEASMNKLSTGKGNLVGSVEKIKLLGLKPSKNIDASLINRAQDE